MLPRNDCSGISDSKSMTMTCATKSKLVRSLVEGGLSCTAAEELVAALGQDHCWEKRPNWWMLAYGALLIVLIIGGFGWSNSQNGKLEARMGGLEARIGDLDAKIDMTREEMVQRLSAIETIINERFPSAQRQ